MPKKVFTPKIEAYKGPKATEYFTDREEPRASFWKCYNQLKKQMEECNSDIKVLTYYGIGGIGKTELLKKLQEEIDNTEDKSLSPKYVYFDFEKEQDCRSVLKAIARELKTKYNFKFPLFELGDYKYSLKNGEKVKTHTKDTFVMQFPIFDAFLEGAAIVPGLDIPAGLIRIMDTGFAIAREKWVVRHKAEYNEIKIMTTAQLYDFLPALFGLDIRDNLETAAEPLVIFLDTYERLVDEMKTVGETLNKDLWLRGDKGVVMTSPKVLWVIAGREMLKWKKMDVDWDDESLEQHLLGDLSHTDAENFMEKAGIIDSDLRAGLYKITKGTPVYIDLCIAQYHEMKTRGETPKISAFGDDRDKLIERFSRYMDDGHRDIVNLLSCLYMWDTEMLAFIGPRVYPNFSLSTYDRVTGFSFIYGQNSNLKTGMQNYHIHEVVASVFAKNLLRSNIAKIIKSKIVEASVAYCKMQFEKTDVSTDIYRYYVQWLMGLGRRLSANREELGEFFSQHIKSSANKLQEQFKEAFKYQELASLTELILEIECEIFGRDSAKTLDGIKQLLRVYGTLADWQKFLKMVQKEVEICRKNYGEIHSETANALLDLEMAYNSLGRYNEALLIGKNRVKLCKEIYGDKDINTIVAIEFLSKEYLFNGNYTEMLAVAIDLVKSNKKNFGESHPYTIEAMSLLASYYKALKMEDDFEETCNIIKESKKDICNNPEMIKFINDNATFMTFTSEENESDILCKSMVKQSKDIWGEKHPKTLQAMLNLAKNYRAMKKLEDALSLCKDIAKLSKDTYGEKHKDTLKAMEELEKTYKAMGNFEEAFMLDKEILKRRKEIYGSRHDDTLNAMKNLADTYHNLWKYNQELLLVEKLTALYKENFGEKYIFTIDSMKRLHSCYLGIGNNEAALSLDKNLLRVTEEWFGNNNIQTLTAREYLAETYTCMKRYNAALQIYKQILEISKQMYGDNHIQTFEYMQCMLFIYRELKITQEALEFAQQFVEFSKKKWGDKDPKTIVAMQNLSEIYRKMELNKEADNLCQYVVKLENEYLNQKSKKEEAMFDLWYEYLKIKIQPKESYFLQQLMNLTKERFRNKVSFRINFIWSIIEILRCFRLNSEAIPLVQEVVTLTKRVEGEKHSKTVAAMRKLAFLYNCAEMNQEALELEQEIEKMQEKGREDKC